MNTFLVALAIAGTFFGPYLSVLAYHNYTVHTNITESTLDTQIDGTVDATETFPSLVTGTDSVCCVWRIDVWDEHGDISQWNPSIIGIKAAPFTVSSKGRHERVAITDDLYDLGTSSRDLSGIGGLIRGLAGKQDAVQKGFVRDTTFIEMQEWDGTVELEEDDPIPDEIQEFAQDETVTLPFDSISNLVDFGNEHGRCRYREAVLTGGDSTFIAGNRNVAGEISSDNGWFFLGDGSKSAVLSTVKRRWYYGGIVSIVLTAGGLGGLYYLFLL